MTAGTGVRKNVPCTANHFPAATHAYSITVVFGGTRYVCAAFPDHAVISQNVRSPCSGWCIGGDCTRVPPSLFFASQHNACSAGPAGVPPSRQQVCRVGRLRNQRRTGTTPTVCSCTQACPALWPSAQVGSASNKPTNRTQFDLREANQGCEQHHRGHCSAGLCVPPATWLHKPKMARDQN